MREVEMVTARGRGSWGPLEGELELVRRSVTRGTLDGTRHETTETWELRIVGPDTATRAFDSAAGRDAFVAEEFGDDLELVPLDPPEEIVLPPVLGDLVGAKVVAVRFTAATAVEIEFDGGRAPLAIHVLPAIRRGARHSVNPADKGYLPALLNVVGATFDGCDQPLGHGFVLDFGTTRLALPREHPDGEWKPVAEHGGVEL